MNLVSNIMFDPTEYCMYITSGATSTHPLIANLSAWSIVGQHFVRLSGLDFHLLQQLYRHINGFSPILKDIKPLGTWYAETWIRKPARAYFMFTIWLFGHHSCLVFYLFSLYLVRSLISPASFPNFHHSVHKTDDELMMLPFSEV